MEQGTIVETRFASGVTFFYNGRAYSGSTALLTQVNAYHVFALLHPGDLTGTRVTARGNKAIAVFAGRR